MTMDNIISLLVGILIGTNVGFVFAGLFGSIRNDEED